MGTQTRNIYEDVFHIRMTVDECICYIECTFFGVQYAMNPNVLYLGNADNFATLIVFGIFL